MLSQLSALEAARKIKEGEITSVELVTDCLARIEQTDPHVGAWAFLDADKALEQAEAMDLLHRQGRPQGPLHGVPVGLKDIFDTKDMPTAWGTGVHAKRQPDSNAAVVDKLHEAGAIIPGKTVTTELAFAMKGPTRNPHNGNHTAGGSSAGSAASVALSQVPVGIGTQTNGSVIRPASFCGIYGFKPTRGLISRHGCLQTSATLDQVGVMGRTLEDIALLSDALTGYDRADPATSARAKPEMLAGCRAPVPAVPALAWFDLPYQDELSPAMSAGIEEVLEALGDQVDRIHAPKSFSDVLRQHRIIHEYEFYASLKNDPATSPENIHETLAPVMQRAPDITLSAYHEARELVSAAQDYFAAFFNDYDAILTPAALGEAPEISEGSGDPVCSTIWTFAGLPCLTAPWLSGERDLPMGVQLVGAAEEDDRLLRTAAWLQKHLVPDQQQTSISQRIVS